MLPESSATDEVRSFSLFAAGNAYEALRAAIRFEDLGKGRQGAVLVKIDETGGAPIVRTTTRYNTPAQRFQSVHEQLASQIQERAALPAGFNNALVENYTNAYTTMGSHSDQALDLADESYIAVFSCYRHPELATPPRKLLVEEKEASGGCLAVPLTHNSVVVFSTSANRRLRHRIVLEKTSRTPENEWLGFTLRTSKTFVRFRDEGAYLSDGTQLTLADDGQRRAFYELRGRENHESDFIYPRVTYTISESDLMIPE